MRPREEGFSDRPSLWSVSGIGGGVTGNVEVPLPLPEQCGWGGQDGVPEGERAWTWPEKQVVVHHGLAQPVGVRETRRKGSE